jgi:hypothetical protein
MGRTVPAVVVGLFVLAFDAFSFQGGTPSGKLTPPELGTAVRTLLDGVSTTMARTMASELRLGDRAVTLKELEDSAALLASSPNEAALGHRLRGFLHIVRHQFDEAEASLGMSISALPTAHAHYLRGFTRLARDRRTEGIVDLTACVALEPSPPLRTECQTTLDHARRNPDGQTWTSFRDARDGIAFSHPADWDVLSGKTPKVFEFLLTAGFTREAATQFAAAFKAAVGSYMIVSPYDATAMTVEIRNLGKPATREAAMKSWSAQAANTAQLERVNAPVYAGIRVGSAQVSEIAGGVRVDFSFTFRLPLLDAQLPATGWRTMIFRDKAPSRTVRLEHVSSQMLAAAREAIWRRFTNSIDLWLPAAGVR